LAKLDPGERDAILLATELRADQLIVDDREGRKLALQRNIPVIGTLGVLKEAAALGLLDLCVAVERLQVTSFYVAPEVLKRLLDG
jgi:predicted nucleic acid-binding protein